MSVHKDKDRGTWFVRWRETNPVTGEVKNRTKRGFPTKWEARRFEDEQSDLRQFSSFNQLVDLYLDNLKGYANEETIGEKRMLMSRYAADLLPLNVREISKQTVSKWKNGIASLDLSVSRKNRIIEIVKAVSRYGADFYDYPDFAKILKAFPKTSDDRKEISVISPEEFELICENCELEIYRLFFRFLYFTGMRRGEAMALLKSDVSGRTVSLNKSMRRPVNGSKSMKTASSRRTITLSQKAYESIEPLLALDGDYVFGGHEPLAPTSITRYFDKATVKAGLPHYRIHDLRHSFVSNAVLNGADIVTVSKYVGHSNIEQTLNTYSHLLKDSESRLLSIMDKL